jgi:hypothetical protein
MTSGKPLNDPKGKFPDGHPASGKNLDGAKHAKKK